MKRAKQAIIKSGKSLINSLPMIFSVILLVGFLTASIPKSFYLTIFKGGILDTFLATIVGSISAGNPITSYILAGEMMSAGISLIPVTSFIVAWVTVGLIQLPAESAILGKKFAIIRNISAFVLAILVALVVNLILIKWA